MAGARKHFKKSKKAAEETSENFVKFLNTRNGYLPGEQVLLQYSMNEKFEPSSTDSIILQKLSNNRYHTNPPSKFRWPVSMKPHGNIYRIRITLPNLDRRLRLSEYKFLYLSSELNEVVGRSGAFKVSDIIEMDLEETDNSEDISESIDVSNAVDREIFDEPPINRGSVKLFNNQSHSEGKLTFQTGGDRMPLCEQLTSALNHRVSSDSVLRVAELIRRYEKAYPAKAKPTLAASLGNHYTAPQPPAVKPQHQLETRSDSKVTRGQASAGLQGDQLFLERFVLPFINGVLEYLTKDGYSRIICRNNEIAVLEGAAGSKILDMRGELQTVSNAQGLKRIPEQSLQSKLMDLEEKYQKLTDELETVKHSCELNMVEFAAQIRKSQMKDVRKLDHKIMALERKVRKLKHSCKVRSPSRVCNIENGKQMEQLKSEMDDLHEVNGILSTHIQVLEQSLEEREAILCAAMDGSDISATTAGQAKSDEVDIKNLHEVNLILASHIQLLEQRLAERDAVMLDMFDGPEFQQTDSKNVAESATQSHLNKFTKTSTQKKTGTNTDSLRTKEEATVTEQKKNQEVSATDRPARVQKATSYAADSTARREVLSANKEMKHTTVSERVVGLAPPPAEDQENWLKLFQRLLLTNKESETPEPIKSTTEAGSSESLAHAMRNLFNICSSPSLASTNTSRTDLDYSESTLDAIRKLFDSDLSLTGKVNSYPPTPCNSADNVPRSKEEVGKKSSSLHELVQWLFSVSDEDLKKALPKASAGSIANLSAAMKRLFKEEPEKTTMFGTSNDSLSQAMHRLLEQSSSTHEKRQAEFGTSNESLAQAMHRLFDRISRESLDSAGSSSSLGSVLMWGLAEPTPKEYENIDIKEYNLAKQSKNKVSNAEVDDCESRNKNKKKKNPSLSSVLGSLSPEMYINTLFPSASSQPASPLTPAVPRPQPTKLPLSLARGGELACLHFCAEHEEATSDSFCDDSILTAAEEIRPVLVSKAVKQSIVKSRKCRQRRIRSLRMKNLVKSGAKKSTRSYAAALSDESD